MITNDMKIKDQRNDKRSIKIERVPNATVDKKSTDSNVADTVKKNA